MMNDQPARSVSILVEAGGGADGRRTTSTSSMNRSNIGDDDTDAVQNNNNNGGNDVAGGGGSPAEEELSHGSPTAIIADEGEETSVVALSKGGQGNPSSSSIALSSSNNNNETVASPSAAINVTNDGGNTEQEEEDGEEENQDEDVADDDESDYSYAYEEDDGYSGFLIPTEPVLDNNSSFASLSSSHADGAAAGGNDNNDEDVKSSAASSAAAAAQGGARSSLPRTISRMQSSSPVPETNPSGNERKQKWREPTRAAVNMSLRAEKEKTGGRRRLASDLYKIMMADTQEAGFSLEPADEDSMDKWTIKLFNFDEDSNLAKDLMVCNMDHVQLEMSFPDQYPFEPPFVRVVKPRFKRQTGFVMSGALCMELLTKDGWNPINDIESVIVSIRSLMVVGDGRIQSAVDMGKDAYKKALEVQKKKKAHKKGKLPEDEAEELDGDVKVGDAKRKRASSDDEDDNEESKKESVPTKKATGGTYSAQEAKSAYSHLTSYHKKEGWDKSGYWARKG